MSSFGEEEENNIKKMIDYDDSDTNIQNEFNNILVNLPPTE